MIQLLLADSHQLLHPGIHVILATSDEITLVETVICDNQLRESCLKHQPDVILLALNIVDTLCEEVIDYLQQQCPTAKILVLLHSPDEVCLHHFVKIGVVGGILKSDAPEKLIEAIQTVALGARWFSSGLLPQLLQPQNREQNISLTERETEVLQMIASGNIDKEIAQKLGIKKRTVRYHLQNINCKLGTATRTEAVAEAIRHEIIQ